MVFPSILLHAGDNLHISKKRKKTSAGLATLIRREKLRKKYIIWRKETKLQCVWQLVGNENSNKVFGWLREKIAARLRT